MGPPSKVPTYPRPVSPLSAESFYLESKDILCGNSQPSPDENFQARAAKRRRIEKLGQQYLRGDGLHILSAGLQGPFDSNWKNPWGKRGRATKQAVTEIPETGRRHLKNNQIQRLGSGKVEEWLKRSSANAGIEIEEQSSPTPVRKLAKPVAKAATEYIIYGPSCRSDSKLETPQVGGHSDCREPDAQPITLPPGRTDFPHRLEADDDRPERRVWVSHAANADRAEFAALKSKRSVVDVAPSSTMLSPFEYRRVSHELQKPMKLEEVAEQLQQDDQLMAPPVIAEQRDLHSGSRDGGTDEIERLDTANDNADRPRAIIINTASATPALSTETSRASVANLPSAQPQSFFIPAPSTNNLTFEEVLAQQSNAANATEESLNEDREDLNAALFSADGHGSKPTSEKNQSPQLKDKELSSVDPTRLPESIARRCPLPDTQDMLAAMSPFAFSTVKRPTTGTERLVTPVTVTKRHPEKPGKSASFAQGERFSSGSSQGSLKTSLRVSKGAPMVAIGKENKLISVGEEESNEQLPDHFTEPAKEFLLPGSSSRSLKSALKSSRPPARTTPFPSTKGSTSAGGIDGGQNVPGVEDQIFDIEGVMDELGSFLSPWDAEKEASVMSIPT